jgi:hypothetical protein
MGLSVASELNVYLPPCLGTHLIPTPTTTAATVNGAPVLCQYAGPSGLPVLHLPSPCVGVAPLFHPAMTIEGFPVLLEVLPHSGCACLPPHVPTTFTPIPTNIACTCTT